MFRVGVKAELGDAVDVVGEGSDVDSAVADDQRAATGASYSSTCTSPAAAGSR